MIPHYLGYVPNYDAEIVCDWCKDYLGKQDIDSVSSFDLCETCEKLVCRRCHNTEAESSGLCSECEIADDRETAILGHAR